MCKHALIQDTAYQSLLRSTRQQYHQRIAQVLETQFPETIETQPELLAQHYTEGGLTEQAIPYWQRAGQRASNRSANQEALSHFTTGIALLKTLPETQSTLEQAFEIRLELRPVLSQLGEFSRVLELLRETEMLAERLNDDRRQGRVRAFMTNAHSLLGELDDALASGTRALEIARHLGDMRLRILTTTYLEQVHYFRGEYERVVELSTDNIMVLPANWVYEFLGNAAPASVYDRGWRIMSRAQLGRFAEAAEDIASVIQFAEAMHHLFTMGLAYRGAATFHILKGDWAKARSLLEHGLEAVQTGNIVLLLPLLVAPTAWTLAQLGKESEALHWLQEGQQLLERQEARGLFGHRGWVYEPLGRTCLLLGRLDEAWCLGDRAVESFVGQPGFAAHAQHLLGDIATHPDWFDAERGEAHYREALVLAEPCGIRPLIAHCHRGLGTLYAKVERHEEARVELSAAVDLYHAMEMTFWLPETEATLAQVKAR